jgi:hypothetical protein
VMGWGPPSTAAASPGLLGSPASSRCADSEPGRR